MSKRVNISVPDALYKRLEEYGDDINRSAVSSEALQREVDRLDAKRREEEYKAFALQYARQAFVISEIQRTGKMDMPPELREQLRNFTPAEREGAYSGWTGGTITVQSYLSAMNQPTLPITPIEYKPPKKDNSES